MHAEMYAPTLAHPLVNQIETVDNLDLMLQVLPEPVRAALVHEADLQNLLEIVLDLGRPPEARYVAKTVYLLEAPISR
ncbi:MAG TPA: single-stranded DNA-binding protein, partial [Methylomirabilota bacterium]|nr:single-stranded DNA-binding protein [Methylomirabilota bacterium]